MDELIVYTDGASRGNPGPAGIGVVIQDKDGRTLKEVSAYLGETTNNIAEYEAMLRGLTEVKALAAQRVTLYSDSELMVKQVNGIYQVKHEGLKPYFQAYLALKKSFAVVTVRHTPREKNRRADALSKAGANQTDLPAPDHVPTPPQVKTYPVRLVAGAAGADEHLFVIYETDDRKAAYVKLTLPDDLAKIRFTDSAESAVAVTEAAAGQRSSVLHELQLKRGTEFLE